VLILKHGSTLLNFRADSPAANFAPLDGFMDLDV